MTSPARRSSSRCERLSAEYYNDRDPRRDKRVLERIDAQVDFDFGEASPLEGKIGKEEFAIQWRGGVIAEETGDYDFYLKTANGARLWVNDDEKPLIDAWVKSGDQTEHVATIRLLGGRVYPLRLSHFKFKEKTAAVTLEWRPPRGARQVVPERCLAPGRFPPVLVVNTPFPPDDRSVGYERGTSISPEWDQAATDAALEIAAKLAENAERLAGTRDDAPDRDRKLKEFCYRFAERAFRRPLDDEAKRFFVDVRFAAMPEANAATIQSLLLVLKSPRFLYLGTSAAGADDYDVAARLSFGLWDSLPDRALLDAAAKGQLRTPDQVAAQAQRMLDDPRARAKVRDYFHQWFNIDQVEEIAKDKELYPGYDEALVADLRTSLDLFVDDVVWSETSNFRQLLLANEIFVNDRIAKFYGAPRRRADSPRRCSAPTNGPERSRTRTCSAASHTTSRPRRSIAAYSSCAACWGGSCVRHPWPSRPWTRASTRR